MKLNAVAWIGLIIGLLGGLAGMTAAIIAAPIEGTIFTLLFILIFGGVFWKVLFKPMIISRKLAKNGVPATAKILEVHDTGVTVNNSPQVKLLLEITSSVSGTYLVETKQIISRVQIPQFQPGAAFTVLVDPNDKKLVSFDYRENASSTLSGQNINTVMTGPWAGISKEEAERKLWEIDSKNKQVMTTGISSRSIVTKYTWLGIYVNGNNPAVELELEVLRKDRPSFTSKVYGVLKDTSIPKYQPGEEIFVKYDPLNLSNITIEHS